MKSRLSVMARCLTVLGLAFAVLAPSACTPQGTESEYERNQALYVTMRDGVKIAIDVWLPSDLEPGSKIPTVVRATRYWRALDLASDSLEHDRNFSEAERFNSAGYALVLVDARGSGASFGWRPYELSRDEVEDYGEVVDWIVEQPWSNGRVGAYGVSYAGNTAEMVAVNRRAAVKAVAPLFNDFDNFEHLVFPGGVLTVGFLEGWSESVHNMDRNDICALNGRTGEECDRLKGWALGVKPVDGDEDRASLAAAVAEHAANTVPFAAALEYEYRDDPFGPAGETDVGYKRSPCAYLPQIEASGTAMLIRVGWLDAATVNGALGRYNSIDNPQKVIIGPWDHGARNNADPFMAADAPVEPSRDEQDKALLEFFDTFLKAGGSGELETSITYYTLGAGEWSTTEVWPPDGFETRRWYFAENGGLNDWPPVGNEGADSYTVDFEATTGVHNRWYTNGGAGDVIYPDRAEEDRKLLTYTSAPMERDIEITGHPLVVLQVASTHTDGAFIVYLEDVGPDGRVTYITEGQLRAVMRKVSEQPGYYWKYGPHRSELRADAMPLVPGEVAELSFELWGTSVLIKAGHRIRVAIAGADKDTFLRYPRDGGVPTITVQRNRVYTSYIDLPMGER
ncbi:MAG: CocE/NonD family hydrolase [Gemmatimonadota bacterium]|nr:MAG: CocE/NonD family hydrolase [Gemmatimonadota bacterium]